MKKNLRMLMRITSAGVLFTLFFSSSGVLAQSTKVTIDEKSTTLRKVIEKIEKFSGYNFLYNEQLIDVTQKISITRSNVDLKQLLDALFKDKSITYRIVDKQIILSPRNSAAQEGEGPVNREQNPEVVQANQRIIKGRIVDINGNPIPGATVRVKGTSIGTATNIDGLFTLSVPSGNSLLVVTFVGCSSYECPIAHLSTYNITLKPDSKRIDEVVVNGYQTISKERATGAFVKVNSQTLKRKSTLSILDKLEGQTSGILYDGKGNISIRGISTLRGESTPLIVVDGYPIEGSIETINPNDVESITVLKDAAAASIWGARAANGVIVIVSKKNTIKGAPRIDFSSSVSVTDYPNLSRLNVAPTKSFLEMEKFLADNGWQAFPSGIYQPPITKGMETYLKLKSGLISQAEADKTISELESVDVRKEFSRLFLRKSVRNEYNLSVSGSGERNSYYMSIGYDNYKLTSKGNDNDRLLTSLRFSSDISKRLKINAGLSVNIRKAYSNGISVSSIENVPQYQTIVDKNGNYVPQPQSYFQSTKEELVANGYPYSWDYNLYQEYQNKNNKSINTDLKMNVGLCINFLEGLDLTAGVQYEWGSANQNNLYNEQTYYVRDMVNTFTTISNGIVSSNFPKGAILEQTFGGYNVFTTRTQMNYNKQLGEGKHLISAIGGIEIRQLISESSSLSKFGYDPQSLQYTSVNYNELYPIAITGRMNNIIDPSSFHQDENRFLSYYGNAAYTYNGKYTISASARLDDSNLFGANTRYRNVPLWSTGINWQLHNEEFFKVKFINRLSLRLTYGTNGNVDKSTSPYLIASISKDVRDQHQFAYVENPKNPDLRWEKTAVTNFGVDYALFNSRLSGSVEYYTKYSTDLLGNVSLNSTYGFQNALMNNAQMKNRGVDVNLNILIIDKKLKWNTGFNFSYNKNIVEKVDSPNNTVTGYMNSEPRYGKPLNYLYSYRWAGLSAEGTPQIYNERNEIVDYKTVLKDPSALHYEGSTIPLYYGNWQNEFAYKGFSLSILLIYKLGYKFRTPAMSYSSLFSSPNRNFIFKDFDNRWRKPGDEKQTDVPRMPQNMSDVAAYYDEYSINSTKATEDASNIRVKEVILSYDLPGSLISRLGFRSLSVSAQVRNMGVILFNKSGIDPESAPLMMGLGVPYKPEYTLSAKVSF